MATTSCGFNGVNSLPLPGAVARGSESAIFHVAIANVGTLESNSPVMLNDVVVGSVGHLSVKNWHAEVEVRVLPDIIVPENAVATIGQTSLLGSMHLALDPPPGEPARGRLTPGTSISLTRSSTYPSTEQTLSSLSAVVNAGGLGQVGDLVHSAATALSGRAPAVRQLISRLDEFTGTVDAQRAQLAEAITALARVADSLAAQKGAIEKALHTIPPALDVLIEQRPQLITALDRLGQFSKLTSEVVQSTQADLVRNLTNLEPTLKSLAEVGLQIDSVLAYLPTFPFSQNFVDRAIRGDYINIFAGLDLTVPRIKRSLLLGTRWGDPNAALVPAPGDPPNGSYTYAPLSVGIGPPPPPLDNAPATAPSTPVLPVVPPFAPPTVPPESQESIFAGPYQIGSR
ncbi:MCE family protein [Mycobacterium syngnathidarum]